MIYVSTAFNTFGKQGAGKGTQAQLLVKEYSLVHLSTGDIFRLAIKQSTPAGKEAKSYLDQGQLVPDDVVIKVVNEKFENDEDLLKCGFVLDGFPRTNSQAIALEELLRRKKAPLSCAINIAVDNDIVMSRITGRRICVECGSIYNLSNPPKMVGYVISVEAMFDNALMILNLLLKPDLLCMKEKLRRF